MNRKRIVSGVIALALATAIVVPAQAQVRHRNRHDRYSDHRGADRQRHGGPRLHRGGGPVFDGGLFLGVLGLGVLLDAMIDAQPPVVVYAPPPVRYRRYPPQPPYRPYTPEELYEPSGTWGYPPPKRYYPECKEFLGNPGALAFCEKGVLERENEEQRQIEQRAYDAGRGR